MQNAKICLIGQAKMERVAKTMRNLDTVNKDLLRNMGMSINILNIIVVLVEDWAEVIMQVKISCSQFKIEKYNRTYNVSRYQYRFGFR